MTDNQLRERAEAKYPLHNDPASDPWQYLLQQAYIAAYEEAIQEMSKGWVSVYTALEDYRQILSENQNSDFTIYNNAIKELYGKDKA